MYPFKKTAVQNQKKSITSIFPQKKKQKKLTCTELTVTSDWNLDHAEKKVIKP